MYVPLFSNVQPVSGAELAAQQDPRVGRQEDQPLQGKNPHRIEFDRD